MRHPILRPEFSDLFQNFKFEAFRLETLDQYLVPHEEQELDRFLTGEPLPVKQNIQWCETIRNNLARGKRMSRVHIVTIPLSPYLNFEIDWGYVFNLAAGEQIFIANRGPLVDPVLLEATDFWLFDQKTLIWMMYDKQGKILGFERDDDPAAIENCLSIRDRMIATAIPLREFLKLRRHNQT
jgi:hypothetical protein